MAFDRAKIRLLLLSGKILLLLCRSSHRLELKLMLDLLVIEPRLDVRLVKLKDDLLLELDLLRLDVFKVRLGLHRWQARLRLLQEVMVVLLLLGCGICGHLRLVVMVERHHGHKLL